MNLTCVQKSESSENGKTTLEKGGTDPPNVTLDDIVEDLLQYIGVSSHLKKTEKKVEKKYGIKKENSDCWPEDDIKRAWGKTQRLHETSLKRERWALAIMLQVMKRRLCFDESKRTAQPDQNDTGSVTQRSADKSVVNTPDRVKAQKDKGSASKSKLSSSNDKQQKSQKKIKGSDKSNSQTVYIRIPLSVMFRNESASKGKTGEANGIPTYKLIDRFVLLRQDNKKTNSYVTLYNHQTGNAAWVYEILNKDTLAENVTSSDIKNEKPNTNNSDDNFINPLHREAKSIEECKKSDYNNGHLAAAANHRWCREAYADTYLSSNMVPQLPALNNGFWGDLEDYCRQKVKENEGAIRNVHVYSGPLYLESDKPNRETKKMKIWGTKAVPTHLFKVLIVENEDGTVELECYKMPNNQSEIKNDQAKDKNWLNKFKVEIKEIEGDSGLRFTESSCTEGEVDSTRTVKWEGKDANGESCCAKITVKICTPLTDHSAFAYI